MIAQATATAISLLVCSLASKLIFESLAIDPNLREVMRLAVHRRELAESTESNLLKLQHYTTALGMLSAARCLATDRDLERMTGMDIPHLLRSLETAASKTRQSVRAHTRSSAHAASVDPTTTEPATVVSAPVANPTIFS